MGAAGIDLSWNAFECLTPRIFLNYSSVISKLWMDNNRLSRIDPLINMTKLITLYLRENRITLLPGGIFNESLQIKALYLSFNRLYSIEGVKVLTKLRTLLLQHNRLRVLQQRVFLKLEKLKTLSLDHNLLSVVDSMPGNMFLVSLICGSNSITDFDFFQLVAKQVSYSINLQDNPLQQINVSRINVEFLLLRNCNIHTIQALNKLENVRYIFLYFNYIRRVTGDVMFDLPNIYSIHLGNNLIEYFPEVHLPSLKFLLLNKNKIRNITNDHLRALPNLMKLNVAYNLIHDLPELSHEHLNELDLRGNYIKCISSSISSNFPNLYYLYLSENRVVSLGDIKGALGVPVLYLSNNQVENVGKFELQVQQNSAVLYLKGNLISVLNFSAPSNIRAAYLGDNRIESIEIGALNSQIRYIDLSANKLSSLSFLNYYPSLITLRLCGNLVTRVTGDNFKTTLELMEIDLSSNDIYFLERYTFSQLTKLFRIDLTNNRLLALEEFTFPHHRLQILRLSSNHLTNVSSDLFTGFPSMLDALRLSSNTVVSSLKTIFEKSRNVFFLDVSNSSSGKASLVVSLSLSNTSFTSLDIINLSLSNLSASLPAINAPRLRMLIMDFNKLEEIPVDIFVKTADLETLLLEGNNIKYVRQNDFDAVQKLIIINLSKNRITHIEIGAFQPTAKLREVNLSGNFIKHLWFEAIFSPLIQEQGLVLDNNPWDCTCELTWLQSEVHSTETEAGLICASPSYMSNRSIVEEVLVCPPETCDGIPAEQVVVASTGDRVRLVCPIVLDNVDTIEWMIKTNSSSRNVSTGAPELFSVSASEKLKSGLQSAIFVVMDHTDIQCSATNLAGTETMDIRLKVCDSINVIDCMEDGSMTVSEWNEHVNRMCHPPTSTDPTMPMPMAATIETPEIAACQGALHASKALAVLPAIFIVITDVLQVLKSKM